MVIFAAKNEENTIENSVSIAKKRYYKPEVLVVDAHSSDKTTELAITAGAVVIRQSKHLFPGKGLAMKEGLKEAIERMSADIIVFFFGCRYKKSNNRLGESIGCSNNR